MKNNNNGQHKSGFKLNLATALILSAVTLPASANFIDESAGFVTDSTLRLKLHNEFRSAERPSAGGDYGPEIEAWVQGFLFDFETGKIGDVVSVEAGLYQVEKIIADADKSTRFYLDGHDNITLATASVNLDFADWAQFKIGRFGTDYRYGSLDYRVPLVDGASIRVVQSMNEGVLWQGDFDNLHMYGLYSQKFAGGHYTDWTDETSSTPDGKSVNEPEYVLSGVWDSNNTLVSFGMRYQQNHSVQAMAIASQSWLTADKAYIKAEFIGYGAQLIGDTETFEESRNQGTDTFVASGQLTYNKDDLTFFASAGRVGNKLATNNVDTDLGFSFDMSMDRNGQDIFAWQVGSFYQLTDNINAGLALTFTDGYEDITKTVSVEGSAANLIVGHTVKSGALKGLNTAAIFNIAEEYRPGTKVNGGDENLKYHDIKISVTYPIQLF